MHSFVYPQLKDQTVLYKSIQTSMSTKLNGSMDCYVSLTIQLISVICLHTVKGSNSPISNISVQHKYTVFCLHTAKCKNSFIPKHSAIA